MLAIVVIKVQTGPVASAALEGSTRAFPAKCVRHAWRASILRQQHPNAQIVLVASILGLHQATARTARWVSSPALLPRRAASVGLGNTPRQQHPNAQIASVASIRGLRRATAQTVQRANTPACLLLALAQIVRSTLIQMQEHASVLANPASRDRMVASASHVPLGNIKRGPTGGRDCLSSDFGGFVGSWKRRWCKWRWRSWRDDSWSCWWNRRCPRSLSGCLCLVQEENEPK